MDNKALRDAWTGQLLCQRCKQPVERMAQHFDVLLLAWCCPPSPLADDEDEDEPHHISCGCEDCMQDYPERFDGDWNNIYYVDPEELAQEAAQETFERDWDI